MTRLWVGVSLAVGAAFTVVPDLSNCNGNTLHWVVLEPLAHGLGIHGAFRTTGPLWWAKDVLPVLAACGAGGGLAFAWWRFQRFRGRPGRGGWLALVASTGLTFVQLLAVVFVCHVVV